MMDGAVVLDKPSGITSHDAVVVVRRLLGESRIGHLGTLDPMAGGVLVLLVGRATRLARFYKDWEKVYEGAIRFGFATATYDSTGAATSGDLAPCLVESEVRSVFREFLGTRLQEPPPFSAKKVSGVPAYRLARKGKPVRLAAVPVTIHEFELLAVEGPLARFRARVSAGAYVRSLAHDLGQRLGTGAHLAALRRTAVGEFGEAEAATLERLESLVRQGQVPIRPLEGLLAEIPAAPISSEDAEKTAQGRDLEIECPAERVRLFDGSGRLLAIAERTAGGRFHPIVVLNSVKNG